MSQRWNDLLFAHWPIAPSAIASLVPDGLQLDTLHGSAWIGVVPFWMDRIKFRGLPPFPFASSFPELNLRIYVRDQRSGTPGVYFLSLDTRSLLTAGLGRTMYNLPYHWAEMKMLQRSERDFVFYCRRRWTRSQVIFKARYRGLGPSRQLAESRSGTLEYFLTERYCLFTRSQTGEPMRANVHHVPWPLEDAEAEIERNDLPAVFGIQLPDEPPVLHYSRRLAVYVWQLERLKTIHAQQRIPAEAMPSV